MDARSLRYFQAVVELGSYSKAARFLRISQPAISRQVTHLETELGKKLLVRSRHGAMPTDAGRLLFEHSQAILRQLENAASEVRNLHSDPAGSIALAVPPGAGSFLVPALVKRFSSIYPHVLLRITSGFSGYIYEALMGGRVDVACLHGPIPQKGFDVVPLIDEEVFLVGKRGQMPPRNSIGIADLERLPLILPSRSHSSRRLLDERASKAGVTINIRCEVDEPSLIRSLLREGHGFSLLSQGAFHKEVQRKELAALPIRPRMFWPLTLMLSQARPHSALTSALVETIHTTVREMSADGTWPGRLLDR
jgi:LysR family nitrogen assimilation transcriptional regulator